MKKKYLLRKDLEYIVGPLTLLELAEYVKSNQIGEYDEIAESLKS